MVSPRIDSSTTDLYITVPDDDQFITEGCLMHDYTVLPNVTIPSGGTLKKKYFPTLHQPQTMRSSKIYSIPLTNGPNDFSLVQDVRSKTVEIKLSAQAAYWWRENKFFNQPTVYVIACVPNDPHLVLWDWIIPSDQLTEKSIVRSYASPWGVSTIDDPLTVFGSDSPDQIRFYTRKIFESYSHEQHT